MGIPTFNTDQSTMVQDAKMALGVQGIYEISSTRKLPLGTHVRLADGRRFVYGKAGATELAPGKVNQAAVPDQEDQAVTVTAAVGDQSITFTTDSATIAANAYAGGFIYVNDDTGEPQMYTIKSHGASTTTGPATFYLYEKVRTAITASAGTVSAMKHPLDGLIIHPSPPTAAVAGVALVTVTAAYYAWFQVGGPCPVLTDGTIVIGKTVKVSDAVDGAVEDALLAEGTPNTLNNEVVIGVCMQVNADTEYSMINLAIPGY